MRVISGSFRGLKLKSPDGLDIRPTTDRIKESLFNIIAPYLYDCIFLDLFSGSGAIGIEALSRGAKEVVFVDLDKNSINLINHNIALTKIKDKTKVYNTDALNSINSLKINNKKFDIIFLDPPYNKEFLKPILKEIENTHILKDDGFIICEQHIDEPDIILEELYVYKIKRYKTTKITFLEYRS